MVGNVAAVSRWFGKCFDARAFAALANEARAIGAAAVTMTLVAGCALPDTVIEPRGDTLNRTLTDYRNEATLLNIVRASYNEPMNFVTLASATGHGTLSGSEGIPTITLGPLAPAATRNYVFGPNTLSESSSNDFNVAVLDDPLSYGALMTPLDVAMMGFFFDRRFPMQLLLPIFVNYMRVIPPGSRTIYAYNTDELRPSFVFCPINVQSGRAHCEHALSHPDDDGNKLVQCSALPVEAICPSPVMLLFDYLVREGLVVQVPAGAIPGSQPPPPARICFDSIYRSTDAKSFDQFLQDNFDLTESVFLGFGHSGSLLSIAKPIPGNSRCDSPKVPWFVPTSFTQGASSAQPSGGAAAPSTLCINGACGASNTQRASLPKSSSNKTQNYDTLYRFADLNSGAVVEFSTRSTWAMYQYLGDVVRWRVRGLPTQMLIGGVDDDHEVFKVLQNNLTSVCFAAVHYSGSTYCVPKESPNSKMTLSLLHELANLYTRPSNAQQPNTGTVRLTP